MSFFEFLDLPSWVLILLVLTVAVGTGAAVFRWTGSPVLLMFAWTVPTVLAGLVGWVPLWIGVVGSIALLAYVSRMLFWSSLNEGGGDSEKSTVKRKAKLTLFGITLIKK